MPIDTSMYGNIKPIQIDSPLNALAQVAQVRQAENQNRLADLTFAQHQRELDSDNALARLLTPGAKPEDVAAGLAAQGYGNKSLAYTKQQQDALKSQSEIGKNNATAQKSQWDVLKGANEMIGSAAGSVLQAPTYENAVAAVTGLKAKLGPDLSAKLGLDSMQIPQDPEQIRAWAQKHYLGSIDTGKQLEYKLNSANKPFSVSVAGTVTPNAPYQQYEKDKAKAGKTDVNLAVNTEKGFLGEVAKGVGNSVENSMNQAKAAVGTLNNINQVRAALDSGKIITGPGADTKILMKQIGMSMGLGGKDDAETLANTRSAMQAMAGQELSAAEAMKGQGAITENERTLIKRAASGDITMTAPEIKALTQAIEKTARFKIKSHAENVKRLGANPNAGPIVDFMRVDEPPAYQPPAAAPGGGFKYLGKE